MKRLITLACLLFVSATIFAQAQTCEIKGIVKNDKGIALEMANVFIKEIKKGATTDANGKFIFSKLKKGKYTIVINYLGYRSFLKEIDCLKSVNKISVILNTKRIITEDIVVRSTRASEKTPVAYNNIKKDEIKRANNGKDITFLLSSLPSIVTTSESGIGIGNTAIRVRGTDPTRINVCVNGIPLNDSESQAVFWVNMPNFASSVDNIQVQRGIGSSTNGAAAFGATVNFQTTKINEKAYANIDFAGGSYNSFIKNINVGTGRIADKFAFDVKYSEINSDGYIRNAFSDHQSAMFSGSYFGKKTLIKANIVLGEQHTGISWTGTPKDKLDTDRQYNAAGEYEDSKGNTKFYKDQTDNYLQNHYQLIMAHSFNNNLNLNMALHATTGNGYYEQYKDDKSFSDYGFPSKNANGIEESDFIRQKHMDNIFYGLTSSIIYNKDKINFIFGGGVNRYDGDHFGKILWAEHNDGSISKNHEWYRSHSLKDDANIFAKINYQITEQLNVYGDVQYRYIDYSIDGTEGDLFNITQHHNYNFVNPKCGATFELNSSSKVYTSFAIGNREPSRATLKDAIKKDDKKTPTYETMFDYELGYTFNTERTYININAYYMDYNDQLIATGKLNSVGDAILTNVKNSYRTGIEISASYKFNKLFKWSANTTLSKNIIKNYSQTKNYYNGDWHLINSKLEKYGNRKISYSPDFIASSLIELFPYKNVRFAINSKYLGKQYFDNTESDNRSINSYFVNDISLNYNFKALGLKNINLQLMVNNVLNEEYEANAYGWFYYVENEFSQESFYFPQAGTNFMLKANINF